MHEYDMNAHLDNHIRGEAAWFQLFQNELSNVLGGVIEQLKFNCTAFLKCFKMIDFFLVKINSYCVALVPMIRTIRETILGHLKALGNIKTLDGQLFLQILKDEKVSMVSLLRNIYTLLRCLQYLLIDGTAKTSSAVESVFTECRNLNQAIYLPHRRKVMKAIQVQHLSPKEIYLLTEQLKKFLGRLWNLEHYDEVEKKPVPWVVGTSHS